jgi:hypothetical protein
LVVGRFQADCFQFVIRMLRTETPSGGTDV